MRIPRYWAEAQAVGKREGRAITIRRFGWSDANLEAAASHAQERANEALGRALGGERLHRRDRKVAYNGADGLPIREETLSTHLNGGAIITRNSYGAHCLNVDSVLFADVDLRPLFRLGCLAVLVGIGLGFVVAKWANLTKPWAFLTIVGVAGAAYVSVRLAQALYDRLSGGSAGRARARIRRFLRSHPDWNLRVYETPAGLRVLVMHRTFDPSADADEVQGFFKALRTDPIYARMCTTQKCFRARLTPKPWRIGITQHMRPRPGVWPVAPERRALRDAWVARYEEKRKGYAACRWVSDLGGDGLDPRAVAVRDLHDRLSGALSQDPIA
ncbi:MAG: hypothetical protein JNL28_06605 [Planctomycetes bacterium]|nr:hypothetical protein [Planctomycetota bacterium]